MTNAPMIPTVRMRALTTGRGYYLLGSNGAVYSFGTAKFFGSAPGVQAVDLMVATYERSNRRDHGRVRPPVTPVRVVRTTSDCHGLSGQPRRPRPTARRCR